ncbi:lysylphosphatidylglycerol synthase transmembrane domain-containing protein [Jatrophihabitans fulvus]
MSDLPAAVPWFALAVGSTAASMAMLARAQRRMLLAGGVRVPLHRMVGLAYAANAVNWTLPGGTALSAGYVARQLRRWGATGAAAGFTIAASGVLSGASFAVLALTGSGLGGPGASGLVVTVLGGGALVALVVVARRHPGTLSSAAERVAVGAARLVRRDPAPARAAVRGFVSDLAAIHPRRRDWAAGLALAGGNWLADLVCLYACCRAIGVAAPDVTLLLITYVVGMTASSISVLPGGIGVVDTAMIAVLHGAGGVASGVSVVVAYRIVSCALVVAVGWACWLVLRRTSAVVKDLQRPPATHRA